MLFTRKRTRTIGDVTSPRRRPLSRQRIVDAALLITRRGGLGALSMRALADELGVSPMALYAHVADKDEIVDALLDDALARHAPPPPPSADWRAWMVDFAEQLHAFLVDRPELLDRYCRSPVGVAAALDRMEAALAVLVAAGFDDEGAVDVFATVQTVTVGFTTLELARRRARPAGRSGGPVAGLDQRSAQYWPALFSTLPPERYPRLVRARPDLAGFTSPARFHAVVRSLLDGLHPHPERGPALTPISRTVQP